MSTDIGVQGGLTIEPPLNWAELKKVQASGLGRYFSFTVLEEVTDTDEGEMVKKSAAYVEPRYPEQGQYSDFEGLSQMFPGRLFGGVDCVSSEVSLEENTIEGIYRFVMQGGQLVEQRPRVTWVLAGEETK